MADFTSKEIKRMFLRLLEDRPYSEITVKELIAECGISRSTFYYHFQDIPSMMEEIVQDEINEMLRKYPTVNSLDRCLDALTEMILSNRRINLHVFRSANRETLERSMLRACELFVTRYADTLTGQYAPTGRTRLLMIQHYKCLLFGMLVDWLEDGLRPEKAADYCDILRESGKHTRA